MSISLYSSPFGSGYNYSLGSYNYTYTYGTPNITITTQTSSSSSGDEDADTSIHNLQLSIRKQRKDYELLRKLYDAALTENDSLKEQLAKLQVQIKYDEKKTGTAPVPEKKEAELPPPVIPILPPVESVLVKEEDSLEIIAIEDCAEV